MFKTDFLLKAYPILTNLLFPFVRPFLRRGHEEGFDERCGRYDPAKVAQLGARPLWIHAVSVGEVQAAFPLVREIRRSGCDAPIILSTVTETGRAMAQKLMSDAMTAHIFAPWDVACVIERALDTIKPRVYITMETEIWPNILMQLKRRGIPSFLVNGRVSDRALARATGRAGGILARLLRCFTEILARTEEDARRFALIGAEASAVVVIGDCKVDALLERRKLLYPEHLAGQLDPSPVVLAGSTHPGEEEVVLEAFSRLRADGTEARLLLVPRHPARAGELLPLAEKCASTCLLSEPKPGWKILIVDRIGVLFELYALCGAAFIGGSLVPKGGQNLQEAACWGIAIQHGPYMDDFALSAAELGELGLASQVRTAEELSRAWRCALDRKEAPGAAEELRRRSDAYFTKRAGATERAWNRIKDFL